MVNKREENKKKERNILMNINFSREAFRI